MFVRSKNVEGWSRCQDSRESAATKRGKIDVKTVYKIGKNMGWIILKRENPSVSRQCSTAFFFLPVPEAATVFSLCPQSCIVQKKWKIGFEEVCLHRLERYFFSAVLTSSSANRVLQNEYVFFFMSSNLYFVEKLGNCGFKCACTGSRGTIFFYCLDIQFSKWGFCKLNIGKWGLHTVPFHIVPPSWSLRGVLVKSILLWLPR